ncbi:prenyltransferase, partial [Myxococcota bacterium]|nr:prenyltransferase [Myxococcota bacterium]
MLPYIQIARPDHWFKNLFLLPGAASALLLGGEGGEQVWWDLFSALIIVCLTASANYTLNE